MIQSFVGKTIYTSYYAMQKYFPPSLNLVAISLDGGRFARFSGKQYKKLAPTKDLLDHWHANKDKAFYERVFREQLTELDPVTVAEELGDNAILLCYEKPSDFCHRHLVAEWLCNAGIDCKE